MTRRTFALGALMAVLSTAAISTIVSAAEAADNSKCHVCHPYLKTEQLTLDHLAEQITCDRCHGSCTEHMHDEMLMTAPDRLFGREQVRAMCSQCHTGDSGAGYYSTRDHKHPEKVEQFEMDWYGRIRPNGRAVTISSICTDCHGTHNLDKPVGNAAEQENLADWTAAFNGTDLKGWKASGQAKWTIANGRIVATLPASAQSGDLWTTAEYEDYELAVTFRADWPVKAGIWTRGSAAAVKASASRAAEQQTPRLAPRVEIFDSAHPKAHTGSIYLPGSGLAVLNFREDLVDKESWNTIAIKAQGNRLQVWLNAEEIGAIAFQGPEKGGIGFHIARCNDGKAGQLTIREVLIQPIQKKDF